jgi:hypothetical protein
MSLGTPGLVPFEDGLSIMIASRLRASSDAVAVNGTISK